MNIKDLKVGDMVFIREDLEEGRGYQGILYLSEMGSGAMTVSGVYSDGFRFLVDGNEWSYTSEMVDWEKTRRIRLKEEFIDGDVSVTSRNCIEEEQDKVNSPSHYKLEGLDIESVDVIKSVLGKEKFIGWVWGNSLKYLLRQEKKNGIEDVKKAMKNLEWLVEMLERED